MIPGVITVSAGPTLPVSIGRLFFFIVKTVYNNLFVHLNKLI